MRMVVNKGRAKRAFFPHVSSLFSKGIFLTLPLSRQKEKKKMHHVSFGHNLKVRCEKVLSESLNFF